MSGERAKLIRLLRELTEGEYDQAPMEWCAQGADAAIEKIIELARSDGRGIACSLCARAVGHTHKWHGRDRLIDRMTKLVPSGEK